MTVFAGFGCVRRADGDSRVLVDELAAVLTHDGWEAVDSLEDADLTYVVEGPVADGWFLVRVSPDELRGWMGDEWSPSSAERMGEAVVVVVGGTAGYDAGMWLMADGEHLGHVGTPDLRVPETWSLALGSEVLERLGAALAGAAPDFDGLVSALSETLGLSAVRAGLELQDESVEGSEVLHLRRPAARLLDAPPLLRRDGVSYPLNGALTCTGFMIGRIGSVRFRNLGRGFSGVGIEVAGTAISDCLVDGWEVLVDGASAPSNARIRAELRPSGTDRLVIHLDDVTVGAGFDIGDFAGGSSLPADAWGSYLDVDVRAAMGERPGRGTVSLRVWPLSHPEGEASGDLVVSVLEPEDRPLRARADRGSQVARLNMNNALYGLAHISQDNDSVGRCLDAVAAWTSAVAGEGASEPMPVWCSLRDADAMAGIKSLRPHQLGSGAKWGRLVQNRHQISQLRIRHPSAESGRIPAADLIVGDHNEPDEQTRTIMLTLTAIEDWNPEADRGQLRDLLTQLFDALTEDGHLLQASIGTASDSPVWLETMTNYHEHRGSPSPRSTLQDAGDTVWLGPDLAARLKPAARQQATQLGNGLKLERPDGRLNKLELLLEPLLPHD